MWELNLNTIHVLLLLGYKFVLLLVVNETTTTATTTATIFIL